ncbi:STAS domain-containing protein [Saccharopolyspora endophytica]|uniref:Anti-sigma factor antagonist n=1 Tax=Saccharopolyspora endophytica TaxID=543886 RepID=A0ABS5DEY7_9PSEU|nr:STAS domain-containing protein [Saccharopolyspora endophytica]MBQ0924841.1 STAS domain-containing protein [Saccharopolyspora endophytica]
MATDINESPTPFSAVAEWSGRTLFVTATGEVELVNSPQLEAVLNHALADGPEVLVLDIMDVTFLSSAGLAVLVRAHRNAEEAGTRFRVVAANVATLRPIQLMGLDQEFDVFADRDDALTGARGL